MCCDGKLTLVMLSPDWFDITWRYSSVNNILLRFNDNIISFDAPRVLYWILLHKMSGPSGENILKDKTWKCETDKKCLWHLQILNHYYKYNFFVPTQLSILYQWQSKVVDYWPIPSLFSRVFIYYWTCSVLNITEILLLDV
jgi:hypothetical protein